jgi:hypothetical protein
VKHQQASWKVEAVQEYHGEVMDTICEAVRGAADREVAERVIKALDALQKRWMPSRDNARMSARGRPYEQTTDVRRSRQPS